MSNSSTAKEERQQQQLNRQFQPRRHLRHIHISYTSKSQPRTKLLSQNYIYSMLQDNKFLMNTLKNKMTKGYDIDQCWKIIGISLSAVICNGFRFTAQSCSETF